MLFLRMVERAGSVAFLAIAAIEGVDLPSDTKIGLDIGLAMYACPIVVWTFLSAVLGAIRKDVRRVLWSVAVPALSVPCFYLGGAVGDRIAVAYYGPIVRAAMAAEGKTHAYAYPVDGMRIIYDEVDSGDPTELSRAAEIGLPGCPARARRIGQHYYVIDGDC